MSISIGIIMYSFKTQFDLNLKNTMSDYGKLIKSPSAKHDA